VKSKRSKGIPKRIKNYPLEGEFGFCRIYSPKAKKQIVSQVITKKSETPQKSISQIAYELGVKRRTLSQWLQNDATFTQYLKKQKILFDAQTFGVIQAGVERMKKKIITANLSHATVAVGVLHDKVFGTIPLAQINTGDKVVKIHYPNFKSPEESG